MNRNSNNLFLFIVGIAFCICFIIYLAYSNLIFDEHNWQLTSIITNSIWQPCTLYITSLRFKARPAKLWELSSQGTEISPKTAKLKYNDLISGYN